MTLGFFVLLVAVLSPVSGQPIATATGSAFIQQERCEEVGREFVEEAAMLFKLTNRHEIPSYRCVATAPNNLSPGWPVERVS